MIQMSSAKIDVYHVSDPEVHFSYEAWTCPSMGEDVFYLDPKTFKVRTLTVTRVVHFPNMPNDYDIHVKDSEHG